MLISHPIDGFEADIKLHDSFVIDVSVVPLHDLAVEETKLFEKLTLLRC